MYFGSNVVYIARDNSKTNVAPVTRGASNRVEYAKLNHQPLTGLSAPSSLDDEEPKLKPAFWQSPQNVSSQKNGKSSPLSDKQEFSVKNLVNSTREVTNWNQLGLQLDLKPSQLKTIKTTYSDPEDAKAEMYNIWKQSDPDASWAKLSRGLQQSGHFVLSQSIYREYVEDTNGAVGRESTTKKKGVTFSPSTNERDGPAAGVQWQNGSSYRINSNIMAIKFKVLAEPKDLHTGDPTVCANKACMAILNSISTVREEKDKSKKVWECEFCQTENEVDVMNEEIPLKDDVLYLLEPSESVRVSGRNMIEGQVAAAKDAIVVFCIDISGSMGYTTEVPGKFKLKGHERTEALHRQHAQGHIQFLPRERRDVTYISRLQGIQGAIEQQLNILSRNSPSQKVALITFNDEVIVCCDGRDEVVITGDKLGNYSSIEKIGKGLVLPTALSQTKDHFTEKVNSLEESGQTALGPAMLTSILLAGKVPGSKIIVCTDGLANVGIGKLDEEITSREQLANATKFYSDLGILAREKSVTVSVLSTKGCESRLLELGRVADITAGRVNVVDPLKVKEDFANILANPVIATQVVSKIVLHSDMCFSSMGKKSSERVLTIPVGNATNSTELSYEFEIKDSVKPRPQEAAMAKFSSTVIIGGEEHIPFQLQIEYTGTDKSRYLRVFTKTMPATTDLQRADDEMRDSLMVRHNVRSMGRIGLDNCYMLQSSLSNRIKSDLIPRMKKRKNLTREQQRTPSILKNATEVYDQHLINELRSNRPVSETEDYDVAILNGEEYPVRKADNCGQFDATWANSYLGHEDIMTAIDEEHEEDTPKFSGGACAPALMDKLNAANVPPVMDNEMSGNEIDHVPNLTTSQENGEMRDKKEKNCTIS